MSDNFNSLKKKFLDREFSNLNDPQREAVFHVTGNLLVLAGAGSGKTTVIINRIYNMLVYGNAYNSSLDCSNENYEKILKGFNTGKNLSDFSEILNFNPVFPENILAITFTNKASKEMQDRLEKRLGEMARNIWASTFHSMCAKILRSHSDLIGYTPGFTIYDSDDQKRLIKECEKLLNIDEKSMSVKSCIGYISNAKDELVTSEEFKRKYESDFRMSKVAQVYDLYETKMKQSDAMDFDDLIINTIFLLKKNTDILNYYRDLFKYIMVDEYQDTSKSQHELIKLLSGDNGNLCVVGDDDQSIYKFRGASIENILTFDKFFKNVKVIKLEQNYRSTKNILNAANAVIKNNPSRKSKKLWTDSADGEKIHLHVGYSEHDEAAVMASEILERVKNGRNYSDFAILYRIGSQSGVIEKLLTRNSIPYRIVGNVRFFDRKEVKDLISYLSVVNNPKDEVRLKRIINRPNRSIGERTMVAISNTAQKYGKTFYDIIQNASEYPDLQRASVKVSNFSNIIDSLVEENQNGICLEELYRMILDKTGYIEFIKSTEDDYRERIENIKELGNFISKFEEEKGTESSLSSFLEEISLISDASTSDDEHDKGQVTLMTIHASKGLEFPIVFLPGFEEGIFPGQQCIYNEDDIEEERRLAYVAITRAKEELFILNSTTRMTFGNTSHNKPSRFLSEIPSEIVNVTKSREWKKMPAGQRIPESTQDIKVKSVVSARSFGMNSMQNFSFTKQNNRAYVLGDIVDHSIFGHGVVTSIYDIGNESLLEIDFEKSGKKKIPTSRL